MSIRLFLADDHTVVRDGLRMLLEAQDDMIVVGVASDGRDAVSQMARLQPDVAVLDIAMPELNGIDAAEQLREVSPSTQVIILSMHATQEHIYRALRAGAQGYLLKESAGAEVVQAVREVRAGRRYLSRKIADSVVDDYVSRAEAAAGGSPLDALSLREREVLQLVVEGKSSAQIAEVLSLSVKTVETYRSRIMHKLDIKDVPGLVRFAIQHGLISVE